MNPMADGESIGDLPLLATLWAEHRRVLGLFRPLEDCHDDFERIEMTSVICEEIRQLLAADRCVVDPLLESGPTTDDPKIVPRAVTTTTGARVRQAGLLELVERLEQLSPEEAGFRALSRHAYDSLRDYVCDQERDLFPLLARLDSPQLEHAERRLRDLRERLAEH